MNNFLSPTVCEQLILANNVSKNDVRLSLNSLVKDNPEKELALYRTICTDTSHALYYFFHIKRSLTQSTGEMKLIAAHYEALKAKAKQEASPQPPLLVGEYGRLYTVTGEARRAAIEAAREHESEIVSYKTNLL